MWNLATPSVVLGRAASALLRARGNCRVGAPAPRVLPGRPCAHHSRRSSERTWLQQGEGSSSQHEDNLGLNKKKKSHLPGSTGTPVQGAELRTRIQGRAVAGKQGKGAVRGGDPFPVKGSPGASPGFHPTSPGLLSGASYLTPLSYSFLICKMRIQNCLPPQGAVRTPWGKPGCPALIRASCQLCFNDSSAESSSMFNGAQRVNCRICR